MTTGLHPVRWRLAGLRAVFARPFALLCLGLVAVSLTGCGMFGDKKPPPKEIEIKPAPAAASLDVIAVASPLVNPGPDGLPQPDTDKANNNAHIFAKKNRLVRMFRAPIPKESQRQRFFGPTCATC